MVNALYIRWYGRPVDPGGLETFLNGAGAAMTGDGIEEAIRKGAECAQGRGGRCAELYGGRVAMVNALYRRWYDRAADESGLHTFVSGSGASMTAEQIEAAIQRGGECALGLGGLCAMLHGSRVPDVPLDLQVSSTRTGEICMSWTLAPGNELTHTEVWLFQDLRLTTSASSACVSGLQSGTSFHVRVRGRFGEKVGEFSPVRGMTAQ